MLLTLDEARALDPLLASLDDEALQLLLDATEAEVVRVGGDPEQATEWLGCSGGRTVALARRADRIDEVVEVSPWGGTSTTLATDDYELDPSGYILRRLGNGTNSRWRWWGDVRVAYRPADDEALRKGVQTDLMKMTSRYQPGLTSETVGSWTTQYAAASGAIAVERDGILARLVEPIMVVV